MNLFLSENKKIFLIIIAGIFVIAVIAVGVSFSPQVSNLTKNIPLINKIIKSGGAGETIEMYKIEGKVVEIDHEKSTVTIKDNETGQLFKVELGKDTKVNSGSTGEAFNFRDIKAGNSLKIVSNNPIKAKTPTGAKETQPGSESTQGTDGDPQSSGGGQVIEVGNVEEISVYYPLPAFSAKVLSVDAGASALKVETLKLPKKTLLVSVRSDTDIYPDVSLEPGVNKLKFEDIDVGSFVDIFSEEDPEKSTNLTARIIIVRK